MSDTAVFVKRSKRPPQDIARKRAADESTATSNLSAATDTSSVVKAGRKREANPLIQSTASYKAKRQKVDSEDEEDRDFRVTFSSSRNVNVKDPLEEEDKIVTAEEAAALTERPKDDGLYHGSKNYSSQLPKASAKYTAVAGPANVRQITITDYQPDVCKDYKETGFCGFGDTCKFLHDRGDYLHGWQLDNIYLSQRPTASAAEPESDEEDKLPFACLICRQPFIDPIVTKCGHFFCSACAIKRFAKTPKCFACGTPTGGLFNRADKIFAKRDKAQRLKEEKEREEKGYDEGDEGLDVEGLEQLPDEPEDEAEEDRVASGSEHEYYEEEEEEVQNSLPRRTVEYVIEK